MLNTILSYVEFRIHPFRFAVSLCCFVVAAICVSVTLASEDYQRIRTYAALFAVLSACFAGAPLKENRIHVLKTLIWCLNAPFVLDVATRYYWPAWLSDGSPRGFLARIGILVLFAAAMCLREYLLHGRTTRLRAYGLILTSGAIGGLYGFCNDLVSATISPYYFLLFKDIPLDAPLWYRAAAIGGPAGISAGCILGAIAAYIAHRRAPDHSFRAIVRDAWIPLAGALVCSVAFPAAFHRFDPFSIVRLMGLALPNENAPLFLAAWWEHLGVYAGGVAGFCVYAYRLVKMPRTDSGA